MGVYSDVHMCVKADAPLRHDLRLLLVKVAIRHEVLFQSCTFAVPKPRPPSRRDSFGLQGLAAYRGIQAGPYVDVLESGDAGPFLTQRAAEAWSGFMVGSERSKWNGETFDGGFLYVAANEPLEVRVVDGYSERAYDPDGELVGTFFDVLTLSSNLGLDGFRLAETDLVKDVEALTGREVVCRATWW